MRRWLVTGAAGQLGHDVVDSLAEQRRLDEVHAMSRNDLDLGDPLAIKTVVADLRPDVIINCAAYTAVDAAETDEAAAAVINTEAPGALAAAAATVGARLIHVSTDYVFAGDSARPYLESSAIEPKSAYGRTKAGGEERVLTTGGDVHVVRTAWVYGRHGANFAKTIARLLSERDTIDVVDDQRGTPTWSADLAGALVALGDAPATTCPPGLWHITNAGATTWHGFAEAIAKALGLDPTRVHRTTSDQFVRPAPRPAASVLCIDKWNNAAATLGVPPMRPWAEAFDAAVRAGLLV